MFSNAAILHGDRPVSARERARAYAENMKVTTTPTTSPKLAPIKTDHRTGVLVELEEYILEFEKRMKDMSQEETTTHVD